MSISQQRSSNLLEANKLSKLYQLFHGKIYDGKILMEIDSLNEDTIEKFYIGDLFR